MTMTSTWLNTKAAGGTQTALIKHTLLAVLILAIPFSALAAADDTRVGITVVADANTADELLKHTRQEANLVHGLVKNAAAVDKLNDELLAAGRTGSVTVSVWDGAAIPFVSDTVNVIVAADRQVTDEMRRALAPYGVVVARDGAKLWEKPYPKDMDEWSHYRYAPSGNGVSKDLRIGPPRCTKWLAGPEMSRHHDHLPSLNAMVSSGGRVFYIFDEASSASILFPPKWSLIARDAFNGVLLWRKNIPEWHPHLWPLKSMPATLPRRLVSIGDHVYVTLGIKAPVTQLNAVDGAETRVFAGSERCEEIVVSGDTLLAVCLSGPGPLDDLDAQRGETGTDGRTTSFPFQRKLMGGIKSPLWLNAQRRLIAYDLQSGKEKWHADGKYAPLSVATDGKRVYYHNGSSVEALDFNTGKKLWTSPEVPIWKDFFSSYGASLVVYDDVVIFSGGENYDWKPAGMVGAVDTMTAVSAVDGKKLWRAAHPSSGYRSPEDLMIAQGLVWAPDTTKSSTSKLNGLDPKTGEVKRTVDLKLGSGFHHRCYPSRATEKYLLASKIGINSIAWDGTEITNDEWVRASCGYGFMPANGLIYATPDPCNCFPESKVVGFVALAKADPERAEFRRKTLGTIEPEKGPAFADAVAGGEIDGSSWPTYRANSARNSSTRNAPPESFKPAWTTEIGGSLSAPVVADGKVFLSSIERNRMIAVDVDSGKKVWTYVTGSRVDSPPTVIGKRLYFGAADGTVTCLKTDDGKMAWRRRLAPTDERLVNDNRIESVWPVHGTVTSHNGLIYAIAGRNMFLDGGLYLCALDPKTGALKHGTQHVLDMAVLADRVDDDGKVRDRTRSVVVRGGVLADRVADDGKVRKGFREKSVTLRFYEDGTQHVLEMEKIHKPFDATPSKPDILSASGEHLFMRSLAFDTQCNMVGTDIRHIYSVNGYLNDSWFHRAFWTYATAWKGGPGGFYKIGNANHSGQIMAADDSHLYSFSRVAYGWGSAFTYQLYKAPLAEEKAAPSSTPSQKGGKTKRTWSVDIPVLARSIVKAGDRLLVIGPEKLYDQKEIIQRLPDPDADKKIADQDRKWYTEAILLVIDPADGKVLKNVKLDFAPVWDGVAVAKESLFVSGTDGVLYRLK